jgi:phosphoribosylanthranilate isomerase
MTVRVKICGLTRPADLAAVAAAGAAYAGFVHFPKSPRHLTAEALAALAPQAPAGLCKVLLTVDAADDLLDALLAAAPIDMLQLHGRESPERVAALRERFGLPVMKAVGLADEADLPALKEAARAADQLLIDAKPPEGALAVGGGVDDPVAGGDDGDEAGGEPLLHGGGEGVGDGGELGHGRGAFRGRGVGGVRRRRRGRRGCGRGPSRRGGPRRRRRRRAGGRR